jgi:hypothetical protein
MTVPRGAFALQGGAVPDDRLVDHETGTREVDDQLAGWARHADHLHGRRAGRDVDGGLPALPRLHRQGAEIRRRAGRPSLIWSPSPLDLSRSAADHLVSIRPWPRPGRRSEDAKELKLWAGVNMPLILSMATVAAGPRDLSAAPSGCAPGCPDRGRGAEASTAAGTASSTGSRRLPPGRRALIQSGVLRPLHVRDLRDHFRRPGRHDAGRPRAVSGRRILAVTGRSLALVVLIVAGAADRRSPPRGSRPWPRWAWWGSAWR